MLDHSLVLLSDALSDRDRAVAAGAAADLSAGDRAAWELEAARAELRAREARRMVAAAVALALAACRAVEPGFLSRLLAPELETGALDAAIVGVADRAADLRHENWELARTVVRLGRRVEVLEHERGRPNGARAIGDLEPGGGG